MPYPKIYVDAMLVNWGDRLFQEPLRHARAARLSHVDIRSAAALMRARVARTLRRTPEVMVKITNKARSAQGMSAVRRHLRYISRNGRIELEDQNGNRIEGKDALSDLVKTWQLSGWGIPETSTRREAFNILLSMPPGTDRKAVRDAARDFAALEFGDGRAYVFAAHDDEAHPHVHLSVQVRGPNGRRLNPRHMDLQRWRERFAEQLRECGVEANATPRRARGITQRYPKQAIVHMIARGETPRYWKPLSTDAQRDARWVAQGGVFTAWREMAYAMARSRVREDRLMAVEMAYFVGAMPVQRERPVVGRNPDNGREQPTRLGPDSDRLEASSKTLVSSPEDVPTDERAAKLQECFVNVGTSLEARA